MSRRSVTLGVMLIAAVLGAAFLCDALAQGSKPQGPPPRIALCNVVKVIQNYKRIQDLNGVLEKRQQDLKAEEDRRLKELDNLQSELNMLAEDSKEYEKRLEELLTRRGEMKAWKETQEALIRKWHYLATKQMFEEVLQAVEHVAKEQGYNLVLFKETAELGAPTTADLVDQMIARRKVLYSDENLDVTDAVMARVNMTYQTTTKSAQP